MPLAAASSSRKLYHFGLHDSSVGAARSRDESLLGSQHPGRGEQLRSGQRVHAGPVGPPQGLRLADAVLGPSQGYRSGLQHLGDEQLHQLINLFGIYLSSPDVALRFGADMPALPGRPVCFHRRQHLPRGRRHPLPIRCRALGEGRSEGLVDHGLDGVRSAERFGGFRMPGGALLGQAAGFVFGVPGFQGGLLRQLQRLHRCRWPTMITLKLGRQLTLPFLDQHPPARPTLVQRGINTDDFPDWPLGRVGAGPFGEPHA